MIFTSQKWDDKKPDKAGLGGSILILAELCMTVCLFQSMDHLNCRCTIRESFKTWIYPAGMGRNELG